MAVIAGWIAKLIISSVISTHVIVLMLSSGEIYLLLMGFVLCAMPWVAGLNRGEMDIFLSKVVNLLGFRNSSI